MVFIEFGLILGLLVQGFETQNMHMFGLYHIHDSLETQQKDLELRLG